MAQDALDIINQANAKAGGEPIGSLDENTPLAVLAAESYADKKALMLSKHRWVFAKAIAQLARLAQAPPECPRTYAFARPAGLVGQIHDFRAGPRDDAVKVNALQLADYIASDAAEVWVEFTRDQPEATWPAWFVDVMVTAWAHEVANAKGRRTRAGELWTELYGTPEQMGQGGLLGVAMQADSANAPKRTLEWENGGALVEARFAGGYGLNDSRLAAAIGRALGM